MNRTYIVLAFLGVLVLCFLFFKNDKPIANPVVPVPPAPKPIEPPAPPMPVPPPAPIQPTPPQPPQPPQKTRISKLLIVTERNCRWCDKLKSDWKDGFPVPHEYILNSQEVTNRWNIVGTPTILGLDEKGMEVDRKLGYVPKDELEDWIKQ